MTDAASIGVYLILWAAWLPFMIAGMVQLSREDSRERRAEAEQTRRRRQ